MGTLYFCIFGAYALSFWFGYKFLTDPNENYNVETMMAVSFKIFECFIGILKYFPVDLPQALLAYTYAVNILS